MDNYIKFMEVVKNSHNDLKFSEEMLRMALPKLRKKTIHKGCDDELIIAKEVRDAVRSKSEINTFIKTAQIYEVEDKYKYILMRTENPRQYDEQLWEEVRLPYPQIFIDVNLNDDDIDKIIPDGIVFSINGLLVREEKFVEVDKNNNEKPYKHSYGLVVYATQRKATKEGILSDIVKYKFPITSRGLDDASKEKDGKVIRKFLISFLLFLKEKDVIVHEFKRSDKSRERRISQGKLPLPNSRIIKLTGELHKYLYDTTNNYSKDFKGKFQFRFDVSAHTRTFRSSRYKKAQGKTIKIDTFEKGHGLKLKKVYKVMPKDKDIK